MRKLISILEILFDLMNKSSNQRVQKVKRLIDSRLRLASIQKKASFSFHRRIIKASIFMFIFFGGAFSIAHHINHTTLNLLIAAFALLAFHASRIHPDRLSFMRDLKRKGILLFAFSIIILGTVFICDFIPYYSKLYVSLFLIGIASLFLLNRIIITISLGIILQWLGILISRLTRIYDEREPHKSVSFFFKIVNLF